jgi:uncharacterized protein YggE
MTPAKLTVRGHALVAAQPDELQVELLVSIRADTAESALAEGAERTQALHDLLKGLGVGEQQWTTSGVSLRQEREPERGRMVDRGFQAERRITVRLLDPALVGRLMTEAVSRVQAQIEGPWWRVNLDNPARAEACRQAIADARQKAEAYSEALGLRLGQVESVAEPGTSLGGGRYGHIPVGYTLGGGAPDVEVHPGQLEVSAAVDVTYLLEEP